MNSQSYVPDRSWSASGHSDFIRELNQAIRQNPVPAALIGAGIAWLFMGGRHTVLGGVSRSAFRGLGHGAQQAGGAAYQGAKSVGRTSFRRCQLAGGGRNASWLSRRQCGPNRHKRDRRHTTTDCGSDGRCGIERGRPHIAYRRDGSINGVEHRLSRSRAPFQRHVIGSLRETASPGGSHWTGNRGRHRSLNAR